MLKHRESHALRLVPVRSSEAEDTQLLELVHGGRPRRFRTGSRRFLRAGAAGELLGVSQTTFLKWVRLWGQEGSSESMFSSVRDGGERAISCK